MLRPATCCYLAIKSPKSLINQKVESEDLYLQYEPIRVLVENGLVVINGSPGESQTNMYVSCLEKRKCEWGSGGTASHKNANDIIITRNLSPSLPGFQLLRIPPN